jgi:hypothetical protein
LVHHASEDFWRDYDALPTEIQARADKQFRLLKAEPTHGSLQFKKIGIRNGKEIWSVRVTLKHRALAFKESGEYIWFWIGEHNRYDALIQ